jgi:hypothetical protein
MPEHKTKPLGGSKCHTTQSITLINLVAAAPAAALNSANPVVVALVAALNSANPVVAELVEAQCSASLLVAVELAGRTKPRIYKFGN